MDIKAVVKELVERYHTTDPEELASNLGAIIYDSTNTTEYLAYHINIKGVPLIVLSGEVTEENRKYVIAHELGHTILHQGVNTLYLKANTWFSIDKFERQADTFAAELLIPDEVILEYSYLTIQQIAVLQGVPEELARIKCNRLISESA